MLGILNPTRFVIEPKILCSSPTETTIFSDLHLIISSVLDADRLDYCSRDSFSAGMSKSILPYKRLFSTYKIALVTDDDISRFYFCPSTKVLSNIEDLLRKRYSIFSEINYHHRVHKHEILLEEVISEIGLEELTSMSEISDLPYSMPLHISSIWKLISKLNLSNGWPEYQIIQLDDSWLDTLLKNFFFDKYKENYLSLRENGNEILWNRFDELISTTKHYHSFFKRSADFREFDKLFFIELKKIIKTIKGVSEEILSISTYNEFYDKTESFVFNYYIENLSKIKAQKEDFFERFEKALNKKIKSENLPVNDCVLRSCMFSFGYSTAITPLFLLDSNDLPIRIEQISSQLSAFQRERAVSPIFHLYYLPAYDITHNIYSNFERPKFMSILVVTVQTLA